MAQDGLDAQDSPGVRWQRLASALPAVLLVCAIVSSALFVVHRSEFEPLRDIARADALIVDSDHFGVLPAILWHADPPRTKVFAASQDVILANRPDAGPAVAAREFYYVSSTAYEKNTRAKQEQILHWLRGGLGHGDGGPRCGKESSR